MAVNGGINEMLPAEIYEQIFAYCNVNDLLKLTDVCQKWRDVICQCMLALRVVLRSVDDVNDLITLLSRVKKMLRLAVVWKIEKGVNWGVSLDPRNDSIGAITESINTHKESKPMFECTTVIDAKICHRVNVRDLITLVFRLDFVTKLKVSWELLFAGFRVHESWDDLALASLSDVTSLIHLESFEFSIKYGYYMDASELPLDALLTLVQQTSTRTLTHLTLQRKTGHTNIAPYVSRRVVQVLEACQRITHLTLNTHALLQEDIVRCRQIIPSLTLLESLDVRQRSYAALINLTNIADIKIKCTNLSSISFNRLDVTPDEMRLLDQLQFVSEICDLSVSGLDTEGLQSLLSHIRKCRGLCVSRLLDVSACRDHLTDDILLSFMMALPHVHFVCAGTCRHLTNEGVVNVIASSKLETISINGVRNISYNLIDLLDDVAVNRRVDVLVRDTTLQDQTSGLDGRRVLWELTTGRNRITTGRNRNIVVGWVAYCITF